MPITINPLWFDAQTYSSVNSPPKILFLDFPNLPIIFKLLTCKLSLIFVHIKVMNVIELVLLELQKHLKTYCIDFDYNCFYLRVYYTANLIPYKYIL